MKRLFSLLFILAIAPLLIGGSCRVRTSPNEPSAKPAAPGEEGGPVAEAEKPLDIGDAEAAISLTLNLPAEPAIPNVKAEDLRNMRGGLDLVTITVKPPFPKTFPLELTLKSKQPFAERPLAVRLAIFRGNQQIGSQALTVAGDVRTPFSYTVDALQGLPQPPHTMLLHAEAEIVMLPEGTNPETVNPATATATPEWTGAKVSNPVRINFVMEGGNQ